MKSQVFPKPQFMPLLGGVLFVLMSFVALAEDQDSVFQQAMSAVANEAYDDGERLLYQLVRKAPNVTLYWFNLGNVHYVQQEYQRALPAYKEALSLGGSLAPAARLYLAKSYRHLKELSAAAEELKQIDRESMPRNVRLAVDDEQMALQSDLVDAALIFYKQGRLAQALKKAELANEMGADDDASALLALIYARQERMTEAKKVLARRSSWSSDGPLEDIQSLLAQGINNSVNESRFLNLLEVAFGHNNNLYGDHGSMDPVTAQTLIMQNSLYQRVVEDEDQGLELRYDFLFEEIYSGSLNRIHAIDEQTLGLALKARYFKFKGPWEISFAPSLKHLWFAGSPLLINPALQVYGQRIWSSSRLGVGLQVDGQDPQGAEFEFLSYSQQRLSLDWRHNYSNSTSNPFVEWVNRDQKDLSLTQDTLPLAYQGYVIGYRSIHYLSDFWVFDLTGALEKRTYKNRSAGTGLNRVDDVWSFHAKLWRQLQTSLSGYLSMGWNEARSTLNQAEPDNKNYDQWTIYGGFIWQTPL